MSILEAIILGIVEGLTEYLPVSSTGHLIIAQNLMSIPGGDAVKAFEICIQGGAILAVLGLYYRRVVFMLRGLMGKDPAGLRMFINMLVGFLPAAVVGLICGGLIKDYLFSATTVMLAWAIGGIVILLYARAREKSGRGMAGAPLEELTWRGALGVGLLQCVAMVPGTSRSLMTMLGGLCVGLSVAAAVEFSFLLGLITLGAATCHDALKYGDCMLREIGWLPMIVGTVVAWASALVAVKWMVGYLNKHSLSIFGWYRLAAAAFMLILVLCFGFTAEG
ncbi:MAG: undecaprenyl-diphosphate phosphatase [Akkermansia sp.]